MLSHNDKDGDDDDGDDNDGDDDDGDDDDDDGEQQCGSDSSLPHTLQRLPHLPHFEIIIIGNIFINDDILKSLLDSSLGPLLD